jgi:hypothetical protein
MSVPIEKTMYDNASTTISDQKLYFDSLPFGQVNIGNNTHQEDLISGTRYASTSKTFDSYGLVATSTDRNGNAASYVYDLYNLYPATTTNALLQKTEAYYNYSNGKVKQTTDPNEKLLKMYLMVLAVLWKLISLTQTHQQRTRPPPPICTQTTRPRHRPFTAPIT